MAVKVIIPTPLRAYAGKRDSAEFSAATVGEALVHLTTQFGDLDITQNPSGTRGYSDIQRDAGVVDIGGCKVRLASLADVIRSKEAAGREKDRRALPVLRELLARQQRG